MRLPDHQAVLQHIKITIRCRYNQDSVHKPMLKSLLPQASTRRPPYLQLSTLMWACTRYLATQSRRGLHLDVARAEAVIARSCTSSSCYQDYSLYHYEYTLQTRSHMRTGNKGVFEASSAHLWLEPGHLN